MTQQVRFGDAPCRVRVHHAYVNDVRLCPLIKLATQLRQQLDDAHQLADCTQGGGEVVAALGFLPDAPGVLSEFSVAGSPGRQRALLRRPCWILPVV